MERYLHLDSAAIFGRHSGKYIIARCFKCACGKSLGYLVLTLHPTTLSVQELENPAPK